MEIKTLQDCCPKCGAAKLIHGKAIDFIENFKEFPVDCSGCGWEGSEVYKDGYFVGHTSAGVMCGYSMT